MSSHADISVQAAYFQILYIQWLMRNRSPFLGHSLAVSNKLYAEIHSSASLSLKINYSSLNIVSEDWLQSFIFIKENKSQSNIAIHFFFLNFFNET